MHVMYEFMTTLLWLGMATVHNRLNYDQFNIYDEQAKAYQRLYLYLSAGGFSKKVTGKTCVSKNG